MTTVVTKFSRGTTKLQAGTAALAIAAAATLTPAAIAQATPDLVPASPFTNVLSTDMFGTDPILGPMQISAETPWWWVGSGPNPNVDPTADARNRIAALAPSLPGTTIFEFTPLAFVPGFLKPLAGWFLNLIPRFSVCFAGLGVSVGPYGTLSVKTGAC